MSDTSDLKLRFLGSLVEQLGAQMYPSATATIAELISNAWDADAKHVWIEIPLGERWDPTKTITVIDDGIGMSHEDARDAYLHVGRRRREADGKDTSPGNRKLHGRKGIGKLAAFGTAGILEFASLHEGQDTRFRLDYEQIRQVEAGADYQVEEPQDNSPLTRPDHTELIHGTRIRLQALKLRRALNEDQFHISMARRFALLASDMTISINGKNLERFNIDVEYRFPEHGIPEGLSPDVDGWVQDLVDDKPVRWWIGFTAKPLQDQSLQGVSVLARGKMVQRPFLFARSQGVTGQLGQEYLVGEVQADWLDEGATVETDHIQANRDQLQLEDPELEPFLEWGRERLQWALKHRNDLRRKARQDEALEIPELKELFSVFTNSEKRRYAGIADQVSRIPEIERQDTINIMQSIVDARDDVQIRKMWEEISELDENFQPQLWHIINRFGLIDARRNWTVISARLEAIDQLKQHVTMGAPEVPDIHDHIKQHPWLIDPRWHLYDDEVNVEQWGISYKRDLGSGRDIDFVMFGLQMTQPSPSDHVIVVEIKRARHEDGGVRAANEAEVNKFHQYVLAAVNHFRTSSEPPRVTGLMIAQAFTENADRIRRSLQTTQEADLSFKTWDEIIRQTERLHRGWLAVESRRASAIS